jgi:saccharopine dehydrogenase-like NADP-dependent oxidoreductase
LPGHGVGVSIKMGACLGKVSYASLVRVAGISEAVGCSAGYCADLLARTWKEPGVWRTNHIAVQLGIER